MTIAKISLVLPLAAATLVGCDRGSGSAGIDGTGSPILASTALSYGSVTALGSLWVSGTRYDISNARIFIDGDPATEADIEPGDVVLVNSRYDSRDPSRFEAAFVTVDDAVEGPITSLDVARSSFVALGQTVRIAPTTLFDDSVPQGSLEGLAIGGTSSRSPVSAVATTTSSPRASRRSRPAGVSKRRAPPRISTRWPSASRSAT